MTKYIRFLLVVVVFSTLTFGQDKKDAKNLPKLSADEIIQKHLASIGTPEAIAAAKSRVFVGQSRLTSQLGYTGHLDGMVQFASAGNSVLLASIFNSNDYPYEKAAFDGKDVSVGRPNGNTTELGSFLKSYKIILKAGFFGGALSTAWPLTSKNNGIKLESAGTTEIGGHPYYKLKAVGGGMNGLSITLLFDATTFRHVATEYSYVMSTGVNRAGSTTTTDPLTGASQVTGMANAKQTYITLTERFADFAKSGDVIIPLTYVINYTYQDSDPNDTRSLNMEMRFKDVYLNQDLGTDVFKVS